MIESNADQIVLGCTHYPFLIPTLKKIVPEHIQIIDPAPAIAERTKSIVLEKGIENNQIAPGSYTFYASGNNKVLELLVKKITGNNYKAHLI